MKTIVKVTDITHEDLVVFFSTLCGSSWLGYDYDIDNNKAEVEFLESDTCLEDKIARCLLSGKKIEIHDFYAEDEDDFYDSEIEHYYDERGYMCYKVSLSDIENGLSKMLSSQGYAAKYVIWFVNSEDGNFDKPQAESIVQHILWRQEIYISE